MKVLTIKIIMAFLLWFVMAAVLAGGYFWQWMNTASSVDEGQATYIIDPGAGLYSVAFDLSQRGMLRWPRVWVWYARLSKHNQIKAGEYRFAEKESPISLLTRFQAGKVVQHHITLVEGLTLKDFLRALHTHQQIGVQIPTPTNLKGFSIAGINEAYLEGWFFPDTYQFSAGDTDRSILLRAYEKMKRVLSEEWARRAEGLPYETPYEALIMASIVEKETGVPYERKQIAGVFVRRLQKRMRLQTDPTVIYGMGDAYDGNITRKNLKEPSAYNTYLIKGLPPTPIAMPGREAINAALHPSSSDDLYFVARGDGTHYFSETLEEHNEAVTRFQKKRRSDYRSSPKNDASTLDN